MIGYALGNSVGPQPWKTQYQPRSLSPSLFLRVNDHADLRCRNHVPWAVIVATELAVAVLLLILRAYLANENKRRERLHSDGKYDDVFVVRVENGIPSRQKVDKVCGASFFLIYISFPVSSL